MPRGLSYPALKCVIEFLDPPRRSHIAARSPAIKRINELIPCHMKYLGMDKFILSVNRIRIYREKNKVGFESKNSNCIIKRIVPKNLDQIEVERKVIEYYLNGIVYVDDVVCGFSIPVLPSNLTLKITKLNTYSSDFEDFFSMFPSDSQVKEFKIFVEILIILNRPIVNSAEKLIIQVSAYGETETLLPDIHKLSNKNVIIENEKGDDEIKSDDLVRIIRYWKEHGKEIGTEFRLYFSNDHPSPMLAKLKRELHGTTGFNEENHHSQICIQLSPTSQVIVYGIERQTYQKMEYSLVVKVVPIQH